MNKWFKVLLLLVGLIFFAGALTAAGDIVVELRLYQGLNENGESSGVIASSYYLKKNPDDNLLPYIREDKEKDAIKRIYKLKKVNELSRLSMVLKSGDTVEKKHQIVLNGRKLWLSLNIVPAKEDRFRIRIAEDNAGKTLLLESEIIVPEGKTAVLGFKDAVEKIYFLAFNRGEKWDHPAMKDKTIIEFPKLLSYVEPVYPPEALKKGLEGEVALMGQTDLEGNVGDVKIVKGDPLLVDAVKKAHSQWKYSIWSLDGVKKPLTFSMIFVFRLKPSKEANEEALNRCQPLLRAPKNPDEPPRILEIVSVSPKKEPTLAEKLGAKSVEPPILLNRVEPKYPAAALEQKIQGDVILKCTTDLEGNMSEVDVVTGPQLLAAEAAEIARLWKYSPFKVDGVSKPVEAFLVFIYKLEKVPAAQVKTLIDSVLKANKEKIEKIKQQRNNPLPILMEVVIIEK